ncbi:hypothetical protein BH10ACI4_BH10ACI4_08800 [soil metagenome]
MRETLRIIKVAGQSAGNLSICVEISENSLVAYRSNVLDWNDLSHPLSKSFTFHFELVDQVRKRLRLDGDHFVDIPIDDSIEFVSYLLRP